MSLSMDPRDRLRLWLATGSLTPPADAREAGRLLAAAREQGVAGLLHVAAIEGGWPEALVEDLRAVHRALLVRGVGQLDLARRVYEHLMRRGLRALPLKGAALAERLYASVADRPMSDVDVLALDDWTASIRALEQEGFRERERGDHAWGFIDPITGGILELHHDLTSCPGFFPVDREGLWARSHPANGQVPRVPATEDLLVQLSLHAAFQHGLVLSLAQYLDIRRLLELDPPDLDRLHELAAGARAEAAVAAALQAAAVVVGAPVGERLRALFEPWWRPERWLGARLDDPISLLSPALPDLVSMRWGLAAGRRLDLLRLTLVGGRSPAASVWRALSLARRWARPVVRSSVAEARSRAG